MATVTVDCPECGDGLELVTHIVRGGMYGCDADGRRGVYESGYMELDDSAPDDCPCCGITFTKEQREAIEAAAQYACETAAEDDGGADCEPDYWD